MINFPGSLFMEMAMLVILATLSVAKGSDSAILSLWPSGIQTVTLVYNNTLNPLGEERSITLDVPSSITAQTVMEIAANCDENFRFTSSYFGDDSYFLQAIGGIAADSEAGQYYELLVGTTGLPLTASPVGYSNWYPFNSSTIRWNLLQTTGNHAGQTLSTIWLVIVAAMMTEALL